MSITYMYRSILSKACLAALAFYAEGAIKMKLNYYMATGHHARDRSTVIFILCREKEIWVKVMCPQHPTAQQQHQNSCLSCLSSTATVP